MIEPGREGVDPETFGGRRRGAGGPALGLGDVDRRKQGLGRLGQYRCRTGALGDGKIGGVATAAEQRHERCRDERRFRESHHRLHASAAILAALKSWEGGLFRLPF